MSAALWSPLGRRVYNLILSVPVNAKIAGIMLLPVLILGFCSTTG